LISFLGGEDGDGEDIVCEQDFPVNFDTEVTVVVLEEEASTENSPLIKLND